MDRKVPITELNKRMQSFRKKMNDDCPDWEAAVIFNKVNQYYFTGTMQDGMVFIPREGEAVYWVRKSHERALEESLFDNIRPMDSFRDAAAYSYKQGETIHLETEKVPLALYQRFQKYFPYKNVKPCDYQISMTRALKSGYELDLMKKSGEIHRKALEEKIPEILREGMSEAELAYELYGAMLDEGYQGITRFGMYETEAILGHIGFGESTIYPTSFNGPGGNRGMSSAVPLFGSRDRKLKNGDMIVIDIGCGVDGYHTDKTMTYVFGKPLSDEAVIIHQKCYNIHNKIAEMLRPGNTPESIYKNIMNSLDGEFLQNFMGYGKRRVKFLGHGIGLFVDELPVIAEGFREPLAEGMTFAVEPKWGMKDVGMLGVENTFIITADGGKSITGNNPGLIRV